MAFFGTKVLLFSITAKKMQKKVEVSDVNIINSRSIRGHSRYAVGNNVS